MKVLGILGVAIAAAVIYVVVMMISWHDKGVTFEEGIEAQVKANQIKYSEFTQTALNGMNIADKQKDAVGKVIKDAIAGRYGENGSKAFIQAITEAYPTQYNGEMYEKVLRIVEAGRRDFSDDQKMLVSKVQVYRTTYKKVIPGFWLGLNSFPRINLDDPIYNPVLTVTTKKTFETGIDEGLTF